MIYLDANFFVFALLDKTKKGENARTIQRNIRDGKNQAVTSVLTLDEVMWVMLKNGKKHLLRKSIEGIYSLANLSIREVSPIVPVRALDFMEKYKLKPRDAFHLSIMEELQIKEIVSDDSDFDKVQNIKRINFN